MKKAIKIILIAFMFFLAVQDVFAAEEHVILTDREQFLSDEDYKQLNEDLEQVKENYDINIYFIYDTSITDSESGVEKFANDFVNSHANAANNVAIVMSESFYYVAANGPAADEVIKNDTVIFNKFYDKASKYSDRNADYFAQGIRDAYQYVVKLINEKVYESDAPVSETKALVNDFSGILSDQEELKLNQRLQKIKDKYGFDAVVVTTDSYNGMSARDYADDFYDYSQYSEDGILFVLNMGERTWYVSTKGKGIEYFTDYGIDAIFAEMADDLSIGKYYDAFVIYADEVDDFIYNGINGNVIDVDNDQKERKGFTSFNIFISTIIGAISSFITTLVMRGKMKNTSRQHGARNYIVNDSFKINGASDMLVNRHVSRMRRPRNNDSSRSSDHPPMGGGGSSFHTSSSGSSHGGHGGHF